MYTTFVFPRYCNTVRCILTVDAKWARHILWPDVFKPNETDSGHSVTCLKLRAKWCGQLALDYQWIDAKIHK
jgi:hypothetical protein